MDVWRRKRDKHENKHARGSVKVAPVTEKMVKVVRTCQEKGRRIHDRQNVRCTSTRKEMSNSCKRDRESDDVFDRTKWKSHSKPFQRREMMGKPEKKKNRRAVVSRRCWCYRSIMYYYY